MPFSLSSLSYGKKIRLKIYTTEKKKIIHFHLRLSRVKSLIILGLILHSTERIVSCGNFFATRTQDEIQIYGWVAKVFLRRKIEIHASCQLLQRERRRENSFSFRHTITHIIIFVSKYKILSLLRILMRCLQNVGFASHLTAVFSFP